MPASEVPAACMPWYARSRWISTARSGRPMRLQYRRAIFVAVSMESDPPLVRNTLAPGMGAMSATRSTSS